MGVEGAGMEKREEGGRSEGLELESQLSTPADTALRIFMHRYTRL